MAAVCVAAATDANVAVVGCADESFRVIDLNSATPPRLIRGVAVSYLQTAAVTPDGKIAIDGGQGVKAFDLASGNNTWGFGNNCDGMVMSADGKILLITWINSVGVIDMTNPPAGVKNIQTPYPGMPPGMAQKVLTIAVSPNGSSAIVGMSSNYYGNPPDYLTVLDVAGRSVGDKIPITGYVVSHVAIAPHGKLALATVHNNSVPGAVMFIDIPNRTVTDIVPLAQSLIYQTGNIAIGDSYAYILEGQAQGPCSIEVLDLAQKKIVAKVDAGVGAFGLAVGPDNSALVVANTAGVLII